jgi:hypothetical protein
MSSKIRILAVRARRRFAGNSENNDAKGSSCTPVFTVYTPGADRWPDRGAREDLGLSR